jgi:hypothetical protein
MDGAIGEMMYIAGVKHAVDTGDTYFYEIGKEVISGSPPSRHKLVRDSIAKLEVYDGKPLDARIEHARFLVDCPNCNNAEFYFEDKLFLCSLCGNSNIGGKVYKVKLPKERKEIETVLGKRAIVNRHWKESETLKDLKTENTIMGVM